MMRFVDREKATSQCCNRSKSMGKMARVEDVNKTQLQTEKTEIELLKRQVLKTYQFLCNKLCYTLFHFLHKNLYTFCNQLILTNENRRAHKSTSNLSYCHRQNQKSKMYYTLKEISYRVEFYLFKLNKFIHNALFIIIDENLCKICLATICRLDFLTGATDYLNMEAFP